MSTVIFKWNPAFSSYSMYRFLDDLTFCMANGADDADFNWSVWHHDKIHTVDEFYMVKVGLGQTGIVAHGRITSEPYEGDDWSGKGRPTFYVDYLPDTIINPDALPLLTCARLAAAIPDFEWDKGHSGLVLTDAQVLTLNGLWLDYCAASRSEFISKALMRRDYIYLNPGPEQIALDIATRAHAGQVDKAGKDYILHPKRVAARCDTPEERIVALLHDTIEDTDVTPDSLLQAGFPRRIVDAVLSVTRREGETYDDFVARAALNPIGRQVKIHDLQDNMDILRLPTLSPADLPRLNKYLRAYRLLTDPDDTPPTLP